MINVSRSKRKTPVCGNTTSVSEKEDKQIWHRRWRRNERQNIKCLSDFETYQPLSHKVASNVWDFDKDGKHWFGAMSDRHYFVKLMRK